MLKKLSIKTNFILIGIVVGLFVGVSIKQAFGGTDTTTVDQRNGNLAVNIANTYLNGLLVPYGNVGIGVVNPTVKLDVVGDIKTTGSIKSNNLCIGATCINENQLKAMLAVGGTGTGGTGTGGTGGTAGTPTINSFTASPTSITGGQSTLSWTSTGADTGNSCALNANGTNGPIGLGNHPANGSFAVSPTVTTTYNLVCGKSSLFSPMSYATVTVTATSLTSTLIQSIQSLWDNMLGNTPTVPATSVPVISSVSPAVVAHGGTVVITGSNFGWNSYVEMYNVNPNVLNFAIYPTEHTETTLTITIPRLGTGEVYNGPVPFKVVDRGPMNQNENAQFSALYTGLSLWDSAISLSISGTTLHWITTQNTYSCQYNVNYGAWKNLLPSWNGSLEGSLSLLDIGLSVGPYIINAHCCDPSNPSACGPKASVTYTPNPTVVTSTSVPVISSVSPAVVAHGGTVVITGSNFDSNSYVSMANVDPTSSWLSIFPTAYTNTTLTITIPTVASLGGGFSMGGPVPFKVLEQGSTVASAGYGGLSIYDN